MSDGDPTAKSDTQFHTIDSQEADRLQRKAEEDSISDLADRLTVLSNRTRLQILKYLKIKDLCVHDLSGLMNMSQSSVSHQLKELRNSGYVGRRKEGRVVYYSVNEETIESTNDLLKELM